MSYFGHGPLSWRKPENSFVRWKNTKEIIINHKRTRMVKDGKDWHGLQTTNFKDLHLNLQGAKRWPCFFVVGDFEHFLLNSFKFDLFFPVTNNLLTASQSIQRPAFGLNPRLCLVWILHVPPNLRDKHLYQAHLLVTSLFIPAGWRLLPAPL